MRKIMSYLKSNLCLPLPRVVKSHVSHFLQILLGASAEGVWVPGGGIKFPCEYVQYGAKKDREIVRQTLQKVQKSRKRKRED